jgi:hypothetical protein
VQTLVRSFQINQESNEENEEAAQKEAVPAYKPYVKMGLEEIMQRAIKKIERH